MGVTSFLESPTHQYAAMHNLQNYLGLDIDILWTVITHDLPGLKQVITDLLATQSFRSQRRYLGLLGSNVRLFPTTTLSSRIS